MQSPLQPQVLLNQRYRLVRVLGQGGFGRTYLAQDEGRFQELCAIKELFPNQGTPEAIAKSQELFQREASTLYRIQHPQIPQFRANFAENGRLFIVQDYVEGKTLQEWWELRRLNGEHFTETEVRQWMNQLLPVLQYLHHSGIIHRDVSPGNIILRESDQVPVLIDFGVVKELASRLQFPDSPTTLTTVGKIGYAPPEQIQTGQVYPNSDLYGLAVTAVVLLTGKPPHELFDGVNLRWQWQSQVQVSESLARVLNRMLSDRPGDRFPSAEAVQAALMSSPPAPSPVAPSPVSQVATVAVGGSPPPPASSPQTVGGPVVRPPQESSFFTSPASVLGLTLLVGAIAGLGTWGVVTLWMGTHSPTPSPTASETVSPSPTATPTPSPQTLDQRVSLQAGETFSERGQLAQNITLNYIVAAEAGQKLTAVVESEGVWFSVFNRQGQLLADNARRVQSWQGTIPATGDYVVQVNAIPGATEEDYRYRVQMRLEAVVSPTPSPTPTPSPSPSPSPSPTPSPSPSPSPSPTPEEPQYDTETLEVPVTSTGEPIPVRGSTAPLLIKRYLVEVQANQVLKVEVVRGAVTVDIRRPNGRLMPDSSGVVSWETQVSEGGLYQVDAIATEPANFWLNIGVQDLGQ